MPHSTAAAQAYTANPPTAPWWHTVLVLIPLAVLSIAGWRQHGLPKISMPGNNSRLSGYITVIVAEWLLTLLIWLALRRRGCSFASLVAGRWPTVVSFLRDLAISIAFLVVTIPATGLLMNFVRSNADSNIHRFTPTTFVELIVFLVLGVTGGGFCEELIFRGYLAQQFRAWTGSAVFAIILQGVIFGLCHGYYGKAMVVVMVEGCLLGWLAHWRRSLRPGMLAHGLQDVIGGIAAFLSS